MANYSLTGERYLAYSSSNQYITGRAWGELTVTESATAVSWALNAYLTVAKTTNGAGNVTGTYTISTPAGTASSNLNIRPQTSAGDKHTIFTRSGTINKTTSSSSATFSLSMPMKAYYGDVYVNMGTSQASQTITVPALAKYTVTFNANGHGTAPSSQSIFYGYKASTPTAPTASGYTFKGWYKEAACTNAWNFNSNTVTANTTLYAKWVANKYTITYNGNGNTSGSVTTTLTRSYNTSGDLHDVSTFSLAKTGYHVNSGAEWNKAANGSGTSYSQSSSYVWTTFGSLTAEQTNVTLYANWKIDTYAVSYNANGGSGAPSGQTKTYGTNLTLSTVKPTRSGYTFKGWATSTARAGSGTVDYLAGATYTTNAALTLYAVWELTYSKPVISNLVVERCDANGDYNDEGAYARVRFSWSVFRSSSARYAGGSVAAYADNSATCTVTVGSVSATPTLSGASGSVDVVVGNGNYSTDLQYTATVTLTDTETVQSNKTTTAQATLPTTYFPMDFNADASAVGFFMPAPNDGEGMYLGKGLLLPLDVNAGSGTDHDLYAVIVALGWQNDVIV